MEHNLELEVKKNEDINVENKYENKIRNIEGTKEVRDEKKVKNDEKDEKNIKKKDNMRITTQPQRKLTDWLKTGNNDIEKVEKVVKGDETVENDKKMKIQLEMMKISNLKKKKEENVLKIDKKTQKSKFKSVMMKFEIEKVIMKKKEDEKMKRNENNEKAIRKESTERKETKETTKETVVISKNTFGTLGESWKGENWVTPTPSSVNTFRRSAVKYARRGQLFDRIRTSDMLCDAKGQNEQLKGKRKLLLDKREIKSIEEAFSLKKLPKYTIFSSTRLGGNPGKGTRQ